MKKALLVTFSYPPLLGPGGIRPAKLKKYLPSFGWDLDVLTVLPDGFNREVDNGVYRTQCRPFLGRFPDLCTNPLRWHPEPETPKLAAGARIRRLMGWGGFSCCHFPDPEIGWVGSAITKGDELLKTREYQLIISSFPPVSSHRVASRLARKHRLPWIADYRDEWSTERYFAPRKGIWKLLDKWVERCALRNANHLVTISEPIARSLIDLHTKPTTVIPNGFDDDDYPQTTSSLKFDKFQLTFTGTLSTKNNADALFAALNDLLTQGRIGRTNFRLLFVGRQRHTLREEIATWGLTDITSQMSWVSYSESLAIQLQSAALFFPSWDTIGSEGVLPSKIFTYIGARKPILFLGRKGHLLDKLLIKTGLGVTAEDPSECGETLTKWLNEWHEKKAIHLEPNADEINMYSRKNQAKQFAEIMNKLVLRDF